MPKVSIIVPVYNVADFIEKCVISLTEQTLNDIEIILVNDGSTDNSAEICKRLVDGDSRIKFYEQPNSGVSVARNKGLDNAHGEWITFVDSDDWVEPDMCEKALSAAQTANADIVIWSFYSEKKEKQEKTHFLSVKPGDITHKKKLFQAKMISRYVDGDIKGNTVSAGATWGKLCKRSLIEDNNVRFTAGLTRAQDTIFWLYVFEKADKIEYIDEYLYHYLLSGVSICSGTKYIPDCGKPFEMLMNEYEKFINIYHENDDLFKKAFSQRAYQVIEWYIKHNFQNPQNKKSFFTRSKEFKKLISTPRYTAALKSLDTRTLPRSTKLLAPMLNMKQAGLFMITFNAMEKIRNRKKNK